MTASGPPGVSRVRLSTVLKGGVALGLLAGGAFTAVLVARNVQYALYSVVALIMCLVALLVVLEPELQRRQHQ